MDKLVERITEKFRWANDPIDWPEKGIPFELLTLNTCRYAYGDGVPFGFCGAPGFPWCDHHRKKVYILREIWK